MSTSPNRMLGIIFGAVYLLIGILGFFLTSGTGFVSTNGPLLIGLFEINPLHNVAHLVIGAAILIAGLSNARAARGVNSVIGAVMGGAGPTIPIKSAIATASATSGPVSVNTRKKDFSFCIRLGRNGS